MSDWTIKKMKSMHELDQERGKREPFDDWLHVVFERNLGAAVEAWVAVLGREGWDGQTVVDAHGREMTWPSLDKALGAIVKACPKISVMGSLN